MSVTLHKIGQLQFRLLDSNGFHERQTKDFLLLAGVVVITSNMKISHRRLADYVKKFAPESVPHVRHDYFPSFNQ